MVDEGSLVMSKLTDKVKENLDTYLAQWDTNVECDPRRAMDYLYGVYHCLSLMGDMDNRMEILSMAHEYMVKA